MKVLFGGIRGERGYYKGNGFQDTEVLQEERS